MLRRAIKKGIRKITMITIEKAKRRGKKIEEEKYR